MFFFVFYVLTTLSHGTKCWYVICDYGFLVSYFIQKPNNADVLLLLFFCCFHFVGFSFCDIVRCVHSSLLIVSLRQSYFFSKCVLAYLCILVNLLLPAVAFGLSVVCDCSILVPLA